MFSYGHSHSRRQDLYAGDTPVYFIGGTSSPTVICVGRQYRRCRGTLDQMVTSRGRGGLGDHAEWGLGTAFGLSWPERLKKQAGGGVSCLLLLSFFILVFLPPCPLLSTTSSPLGPFPSLPLSFDSLLFFQVFFLFILINLPSLLQRSQ